MRQCLRLIHEANRKDMYGSAAQFSSFLAESYICSPLLSRLDCPRHGLERMLEIVEIGTCLLLSKLAIQSDKQKASPVCILYSFSRGITIICCISCNSSYELLQHWPNWLSGYLKRDLASVRFTTEDLISPALFTHSVGGGEGDFQS